MIIPFLPSPLSQFEAPRGEPLQPTYRVARAVTHVLAPTELGLAVIVLTALHADGVAGLGWAALTAVFAPGLPLVYLLSGVRRGRYSDIHVRAREQRRPLLLFAVGSVGCALGLLWVFSAPRALIALILAMLAGLFVFGLVTLAWKISFHTGTAAGVTVVLALQFGPWAMMTTLLVALIGWSRVRLADHTVAQVSAGAGIGAVVAATVFAALT